MSAEPAPATLPTTAQCLGCRYPLRDLDSRQCPECGRSFDPGDPRTFRLGERPPWLGRQLAPSMVPITVWTVVTLVATFVLVALLGEPADERFSARMAAIVVGAALGAAARGRVRAALVRHFPHDVPPRGLSPGVHRRLVGSVLALGIVAAGFGSGTAYTCPHGTVVGIFGVGVAHSHAAGGPCRNVVEDLTAVHLTGDWYLWWG